MAKIGEDVRAFDQVRTSDVKQPIYPNQFPEFLELLQSTQQKFPRKYAVSLTFYKAWCYRLLNQQQDALDTIKAGLQNSADLPELLRLRVKIVYGRYQHTDPPDHIRKRIQEWENEIGRLLPLSSKGRDSDYAANPNVTAALVDPPPPPIPYLVHPAGLNPLKKVPPLYKKMNCFSEAVDAYIEAIPSASYIRTEKGKSGRELKASYWLQVGELEGKLGHYGLAFRAYLKSAFTDKSFVRRATEGVSASLAEEPKVELPRPKLEAETMKRIARLYARMNVHPLAFSVLKRAEKETGADLAGQKEQVRQEWQKILEKYKALPGGVPRFFFGHELSEVENLGEVEIRRPSDTFWKPVKKTQKE